MFSNPLLNLPSGFSSNIHFQERIGGVSFTENKRDEKKEKSKVVVSGFVKPESVWTPQFSKPFLETVDQLHQLQQLQHLQISQINDGFQRDKVGGSQIVSNPLLPSSHTSTQTRVQSLYGFNNSSLQSLKSAGGGPQIPFLLHPITRPTQRSTKKKKKKTKKDPKKSNPESSDSSSSESESSDSDFDQKTPMNPTDLGDRLLQKTTQMKSKRKGGLERGLERASQGDEVKGLKQEVIQTPLKTKKTYRSMRSRISKLSKSSVEKSGGAAAEMRSEQNEKNESPINLDMKLSEWIGIQFHRTGGSGFQTESINSQNHDRNDDPEKKNRSKRSSENKMIKTSRGGDEEADENEIKAMKLKHTSPTTVEGKIKDLEKLNREIHRAMQILNKTSTGKKIPKFQLHHMKTPLFQFHLGSEDPIMESLSSTQFDLPRKFLRKVNKMKNRDEPPREPREPNESKHSKPTHCEQILMNSNRTFVRVKPSNFLCLFPDRWIDSVIINFWSKLCQSHYVGKQHLLVKSAQDDPSLREIMLTPKCFKYIMIPLFRKSHWTVLFINHEAKIIRYLNSQVFNKAVPSIQTEPFRQLFPDYTVYKDTIPAQCDHSSCGVYVCFWIMCFLFGNHEDMDSITCAKIDEFRDDVLIQLLASSLTHQSRWAIQFV